MIMRQENENENIQTRMFDRLHRQKFTNQVSFKVAEKRRLVSHHPKKEKEDEDIVKLGRVMGKKSKSIGSLLPRINEIETIAKSEKKDKFESMSRSLTKLEVYLTRKNIKKEELFNTLFITQNTKILSDKAINDKFAKFISIQSEKGPNNLRALMSITSEIDKTPTNKKIANHKNELKEIVKEMIEEQKALKKVAEVKYQYESSSSEESVEEQEPIPNKNDYRMCVSWVLKECDKFEKKIKADKKKKKKKD